MPINWLKIILLFIFTIFLISFISSAFDYDNPNLPKLEPTTLSGNITKNYNITNYYINATYNITNNISNNFYYNITTNITNNITIIYNVTNNVTNNYNFGMNYTNLAFTNQSNDFGIYNQTTTGWWNGLFNWFIDAGSLSWLNFNGTTLSFNESNINNYITTNHLGGNESWNESYANSLYVPYTGAITNIDLGIYDLTTTGNISASAFTGDDESYMRFTSSGGLVIVGIR